MFDVLVVGGGLVGASVALGAAALGQRTAIIEQQRPQPRRGRLGMDLRTVALAPPSQAILADLDVWREVSAVPYRSMRVWEERGAAELEFDAEEAQREELGWILEASVLSAALWRQLDACSGLERLVGEPVTGVSPVPGGMAVSTSSGTVSARLVIAADGGQSAIRGQLGVRVKAWETDQVATATVAQTAEPHNQTACQCFLLPGPLALLPGNGERLVSVVWSQPEEQAVRRQQLGDAEFRQELAQASGYCHGEVLDVDKRLSFPVSQAIAATPNPHQRVLLIGDAARVIHPLAGLGVNLGFEDVAGVLEGLRRAPGKDPGAAGRWRTFARRRQARGRAMIGFLGGLRAFYGMPQPAAHWLRNQGVRFVNRSAPIKGQLIREALGFGPIAERLR